MTASNGSINSDISFDEVLYIPHSAQLDGVFFNESVQVQVNQ